jgi:hypothetical protein
VTRASKEDMLIECCAIPGVPLPITFHRLWAHSSELCLRQPGQCGSGETFAVIQRKLRTASSAELFQVTRVVYAKNENSYQRFEVFVAEVFVRD